MAVTGGHAALARVLHDEWDIAGKTLTLRVFRWQGANRILIGVGVAESGPSTRKGVAVPSPALPQMDFPGDGSNYELEIETSQALSYSAEVMVK